MERCRACGESHPDPTQLCPRTGGDPRVGPCGSRVDRYDVESWLGGGGAGNVYRARHSHIGQRVALKMLRPEMVTDPDVVARFLREARAAAAARSPHIVSVTDFGVSSEGVPFLVMEHLEGETLYAVLAREGRLAPARALEIGRQILDGLAAAHVAGVVHRDVKPANVLITRDASGRETARVVDFGISKVHANEFADVRTATGVVLGTPGYMSPEQFVGTRDVDARADVYAAAVVIDEMLTGERLRTDDEAMAQLAGASVSPRRSLAERCPGLAPGVVAALERALADDPALRFSDAGEFAAALRANDEPVARGGNAFEDKTVAMLSTPPTRFAPAYDIGEASTLRAPESPRTVRRARVARGALAGIVSLGLLAVVAAVWFGTRDGDEPSVSRGGVAEGVHVSRVRLLGTSAEVAPESAVAPVLPALEACRTPGVTSRMSVMFSFALGRLIDGPFPLGENQASTAVLDCVGARLRERGAGTLSGGVELDATLDPL